MFTDPIVTNISFLSRTCPRISIQGQCAEYKSADGVGVIKISHQNAKNRTRRLVRFEGLIAGTDPVTTGASTARVNCYLVIDQPSQAVFTDSSSGVKEVATNLMSWLTASTNANLIKVIGSEI